MLRRTLTGVAIQVCTQFTGINVSTYFQPTCKRPTAAYRTASYILIFAVYRALGLSGSKVLMITGINGALGTVVTLAFIAFFLDRVGRKPPLVFGTCYFLCGAG